ncbi:unnamed protein product [Rhizoctonia solani]|nr:unnamed protein product [Rhizoctonia solani]
MAQLLNQGEGTVREIKIKEKGFVILFLQYKTILSKSKTHFSDVFESKRRREATNSTDEQAGNAQIISHLLPVNVVFLSRSNHFFRDWLMSRSSRYIWISAMKNIKDLPPCPPDMSEPYYVTLLFLPCCTVCGESEGCVLHFRLRLRLCATCRSEYLLTIRPRPRYSREPGESEWPRELEELAHSVEVFTRSGCIRRRLGFTVVKEEASDICLKLEELQQIRDEAALNTWKEERMVVVNERERQANAVNRFLYYWEHSQRLNNPQDTPQPKRGNRRYWPRPMWSHGEQPQS